MPRFKWRKGLWRHWQRRQFPHMFSFPLNSQRAKLMTGKICLKCKCRQLTNWDWKHVSLEQTCVIGFDSESAVPRISSHYFLKNVFSCFAICVSYPWFFLWCFFNGKGFIRGSDEKAYMCIALYTLYVTCKVPSEIEKRKQFTELSYKNYLNSIQIFNSLFGHQIH